MYSISREPGTVALRSDCRFHDHVLIPHWYTQRVGWYHSVGITTRYALNGLGNESRWGARFSASALGPPIQCVLGLSLG
jgi:hypothetical protein